MLSDPYNIGSELIDSREIQVQGFDLLKEFWPIGTALQRVNYFKRPFKGFPPKPRMILYEIGI
jgi:hypothetical protein